MGHLDKASASWFVLPGRWTMSKSYALRVPVTSALDAVTGSGGLEPFQWFAVC